MADGRNTVSAVVTGHQAASRRRARAPGQLSARALARVERRRPEPERRKASIGRWMLRTLIRRERANAWSTDGLASRPFIRAAHQRMPKICFGRRAKARVRARASVGGGVGAAGRTPGLPSAEAARREEPEFEHVSETADGQARQQAGTQTGEHACTQKSTHKGQASERPHKNRAPRPSVVEAERQALERPSTRDGRVPETSSAGAVQRQNLQRGRASAWPSKHQAEGRGPRPPSARAARARTERG